MLHVARTPAQSHDPLRRSTWPPSNLLHFRASCPCCFAACTALADRQQDPELGKLLEQALQAGECFEDKFEQQVWLAAMEPKLATLVKDAKERADILHHVHCEARRLELPPGLVMAVIDVESRFDRWAVSHAGAVGLMQIMPFWPRELGMTNQELVRIPQNIRMGCTILKFYLDREKGDYTRRSRATTAASAAATTPIWCSRDSRIAGRLELGTMTTASWGRVTRHRPSQPALLKPPGSWSSSAQLTSCTSTSVTWPRAGRCHSQSISACAAHGFADDQHFDAPVGQIARITGDSRARAPSAASRRDRTRPARGQKRSSDER